LILRQQNELGTKLVEIDARPSDCLALASAVKRPIFVTRSLFRDVEDMSEHLAGANEHEDADEEDNGEEPGEQA
jgi:bifunctional DNase/RNase